MNDVMKNKNKKSSVPGLAKWLLGKVTGGISESKIGDFEEEYFEVLNEKGYLSARFNYWKQLLKTIFILKLVSLFRGVEMLKNYIKVSCRNLVKYKVFSMINISGLAVGMTGCILAFIFVRHELSYDRFHKNLNQIYRITRDWVRNSGDVWRTTSSGHRLAQYLSEDFPEIKNTVRLAPRSVTINHKNILFREKVLYTEPSFFEIFSFSLEAGDRKTILKEPFTGIITRDLGAKYFGKADPVGRVLSISGKDYRITGILDDMPENTHLKKSLLLSFSSFVYGQKDEEIASVYTYIQLRKDSSSEELDSKLHDFSVRHFGEKVASRYKYHLQALKDIHLGSTDIMLDKAITSDIKYSYTYSLIAIFILVIAGTNFVNLSTARVSCRIKEIGVRKVAGAKRIQLIRQFISESVIISSAATSTALIIALLVLPSFNSYTDKNLEINIISDPGLLIFLLSFTIFVGFAAGMYPAYVTSSFSPLDSIKTKRIFSGKGAFIRRSIIVFQFVLSIVFITVTLIIMGQMDFVKKRKLGFDSENVIVVDSMKDRYSHQRLNMIRSELLKNPDIIDISGSFSFPGTYAGISEIFRYTYDNDEVSVKMNLYMGYYDFFKFYNIEVIEGRDFSREIPTDSTEGLILNETAVKKMGLKSPLGTIIRCPNREIQGKVIGVVSDFHHSSLHKKISPTVYKYFNLKFYYSVKVRGRDIPGTIRFLEDKWKEFAPGEIFQCSFLDENIAKQYREDMKTERILSFSSVLAIFIACLGLFGLSLFTGETRKKEIGIRKILGASGIELVGILSSVVIRLVITANIIAWPIAYFLIKIWLESFAYRINIDIWFFIMGGILALLIAAVTISVQTIKAANNNPVNSLRNE